MKPSHPEQILSLARERGVLRTRDVLARGIPSVVLTRMVTDGRLERVARGIYIIPGEGLASGTALAVVATRVPGAVVCLASALQLHELSTWVSPEVWIAVRSKRRTPRVDWPPLKVVYVKPELLEQGVEERVVDGVTVRVTTAARTVADCFKWRSTVGIDIALEALRAYVERGASRDELRACAERLRVARVMRPYLEALS
jgi:predicted transcriptional regulator of viral defense system